MFVYSSYSHSPWSDIAKNKFERVVVHFATQNWKKNFSKLWFKRWLIYQQFSEITAKSLTFLLYNLEICVKVPLLQVKSTVIRIKTDLTDSDKIIFFCSNRLDWFLCEFRQKWKSLGSLLNSIRNYVICNFHFYTFEGHRKASFKFHWKIRTFMKIERI